MDDIYLDFLTPDVWNGLVLAIVLIGGALGALRLIEDRKAYRRQQDRRARQRADLEAEAGADSRPATNHD